MQQLKQKLLIVFDTIKINYHCHGGHFDHPNDHPDKQPGLAIIKNHPDYPLNPLFSIFFAIFPELNFHSLIDNPSFLGLHITDPYFIGVCNLTAAQPRDLFAYWW